MKTLIYLDQDFNKIELSLTAKYMIDFEDQQVTVYEEYTIVDDSEVEADFVLDFSQVKELAHIISRKEKEHA